MSFSFDNPNTPPRRRRQTDTLADSVLILLALSVVQRLIGFVRAVLFCRWLDAEQLGLWDMAFSFLMLAAPLAVLAIPGAFGRYLEHYRQRGQLHTFLRRTAPGVRRLGAGGLRGRPGGAAMGLPADLRQRGPDGRGRRGGRKPDGRDRLQFPRSNCSPPCATSGWCR